MLHLWEGGQRHDIKWFGSHDHSTFKRRGDDGKR
jgi:hypothetical protein